MPLVGNPVDWDTATIQGVCFDALVRSTNGDGSHTDARSCSVCHRAYASLKPNLGSGVLTFKSGGVEMGPGKARGRKLLWKIAEVHAYVVSFNPSTEPEPAPIVVEPEPVPAILPDTVLSEAHEVLLREVRRLRNFAAERDIDHISYRPIRDGARMIGAGIPVEACLHAMTMHWDDADRRQAGVQPYDPATDFPGGMSAYLDALVEARIPIYLFGPAGMGKSYWAEKLAERRNVDYGFTPMTEGASVSWLLGRVDAQGFKPTKLLKIWQYGGVYLFDEADASDPNMLLVMNGPLANDLLENPVDQESYRKSEACVIIFAGNTDGLGADANYGARNAFDFSTFDRIRMGRAHIGYDPDVERQVMLAQL